MKKEIFIYVGILAVLLLVISRIKFDLNPFDSSGTEKSKLPPYLKKELEQENETGPSGTLSKNDLVQVTNVLQTSMAGLGTDEQSIFTQVNRIKNQTDWNNILIVWGVRDGLDLWSWFVDDLSTGEMRIVSDILTKNGVII